MSGFAIVSLSGTVGRTPPKKAIARSGKPYCVFYVRTVRRYRTSAGGWVSEPDWHRVVVNHPDILENITSARLSAGALVQITGEISYALAPGEKRDGKRHPKKTDRMSVVVNADIGNMVVLQQGRGTFNPPRSAAAPKTAKAPAKEKS